MTWEKIQENIERKKRKKKKIFLYLTGSKSKAVPLHAMELLGGEEV
jgi:hypothetical protein